MHDVHAEVGGWMSSAGMDVSIDELGNLRGVFAGASSRRLYIGSHLDTVPHAGAFDGILGVVAGIALVGQLNRRELPFTIEVVGFSDEEGVRFGVPFIGSRGFAGTADAALRATCDCDGISIARAIELFGIGQGAVPSRAEAHAIGWIELHIEQGPVLELLDYPLGVVESIVGQSRFDVTLSGTANHAGTTPMPRRRDALAGMAEWIVAVEREAQGAPGLVATVGRIEAEPGATNVIAGECRASLDVRHARDDVRESACDRFLTLAGTIAARRNLRVASRTLMSQAAVSMDAALTARLAASVDRAGYPLHRMSSGAGHDSMIVAPLMPAAMLFVRSPGGISHHPDETVTERDVAAALDVLVRVVNELAASYETPGIVERG
jgi:allantoate deiminase